MTTPLQKAIEEARNEACTCTGELGRCVVHEVYNHCLEIIRQHESQQAVDDCVAMRYGWDGYGYKYIDSGSGSDWQTRYTDAEPLYLRTEQPKVDDTKRASVAPSEWYAQRHDSDGGDIEFHAYGPKESFVVFEGVNAKADCAAFMEAVGGKLHDGR